MDRWLNFKFLLDVPIEDIFIFHFVVVIGYSLADSIVLDFIVLIRRYLDALLFLVVTHVFVALRVSIMLTKTALCASGIADYFTPVATHEHFC
jgi:hypothetical protein